MNPPLRRGLSEREIRRYLRPAPHRLTLTARAVALALAEVLLVAAIAVVLLAWLGAL